MKQFIIISLVWSSLMQCSPKKVLVSTPGAKLFEMSKSPCFGYCPVYNVTIYQSGIMKLHAKQNMNINGMYTYQLTKVELKEIKSTLKDLNLAAFRDEYREPIADAPSTEIIYFGENPEKKIFTNYQYPGALQRFADRIDSMALSYHWEKLVENRTKTEFILQLEPGMTIADVLQKYNAYEMMLGKRLDPATNQYWTVTAMIEPGTTNAFIKMLSDDPAIQQAQLNKSLDLRTR
ncbi:MAG: DUF6438 domain-containing protein [Saprospiraceae bacterium]